MEREIRKKTLAYGFSAILLAGILTVACIHFGLQPIIIPMSLQLTTFSSYEELENFLKTNMERAKGFGEGFWLRPAIQSDPFWTAEERLNALDSGFGSTYSYSTTNIQVAGVDEADIVKTDGEYLYVVADENIYILKAYPPDQAEILSKISLSYTRTANIFIKDDKLAVIGTPSIPQWYAPELYPFPGAAYIEVYDISNRSHPTLTRNLSLNGTISGSRMIGDYIYTTVSQYAVDINNETHFHVALPKIISNTQVIEILATEVLYVDAPDIEYHFTSIVGINILNDGQEPTFESFLTGSTTCMYVSGNNMYLAVPNSHVWLFRAPASEAREETFLYRIRLNEAEIQLEAEGTVYGSVLNQFSMDEYEGHFRIATTQWTAEGPVNSVYTLNMNLSEVGALEGLAPGEQIYSARFMGDKCYLVTFFQIDPFFVIDLSIPTEPKVLGYLKIPGFSGYLHPYDEHHIIGVGKEDGKVKLSLFNVENVSSPKETSKFIFPGAWSHTPVLEDHKAFLFDKTKNLLALPITVTNYSPQWQAAYVFRITIEDGFQLKGSITHHSNMTYFNYRSDVKRILYINDILYTISETTVKMNDIETLTQINKVLLV